MSYFYNANPKADMHIPRHWNPLLRQMAFLLLVLALLAGSGCEKDDICVDGDTPLLVVTFYDIENPGEAKAVNRLRAVGLGNGTPVTSFPDRSTRDSIGIPLRIDSGQTGFVLIQNSEDEEGADVGNRDTLYFDYEIREEFVSRACGFVGQFDNLEVLLQSDASNWIDSVTVISTTVENSLSAHVSVYH